MKQVNEVSIPVLDQLTDVAQQQQKSLEVFVTLYSHERLLVRLAASSYEDQYWLYGDRLIGALTNNYDKSSTGITLCAKKMANKDSIIQHAFKEICSVNVPEDGIEFVSDELEITTSDEDQIHIRMPAQLGHITTYIEIKINLFDRIAMAPKTMALQTILDNSPIELLAYPTELMIAHKFNLLYQYPACEQAMKEYYDVYLLASTQNFEGRVLQEAISDTFDRHKTTLEKYPSMFSKQLYLDATNNKRWQQLVNQQTLPFDKVQKLVHQLLVPIYEEVIVENEFFENWDYKLGDWQ
ncbi:nucleotidyl transferase AbiEii/AbiGii toxin family protein [Lysinibacillus sp. FSL W8-0992]|uniref:nucleotidyl transferase AbiEii/AbiGii toxin family protein n=1 Tax=Lysinibacillus sp. FSL W8-0992 TaxID=2954643 RepID=UPI0030FC9B09